MAPIPPEFAPFAENLRAELQAQGLCDSVLVDQVVWAAVRLKVLRAHPLAYRPLDPEARVWERAHEASMRAFLRGLDALSGKRPLLRSRPARTGGPSPLPPDCEPRTPAGTPTEPTPSTPVSTPVATTKPSFAPPATSSTPTDLPWPTESAPKPSIAARRHSASSPARKEREPRVNGLERAKLLARHVYEPHPLPQPGVPLSFSAAPTPSPP